MIQLSALTASGTEIPGKTAGLAMLKGEFERLLSSETHDGTLPGGKFLPEAGKDLPNGLPVVELSPLEGRTLIGVVSMTGETGNTDDSESLAEGDVPALIVAGDPERPTATAPQQAQPLSPTDISAVVAMIALEAPVSSPASVTAEPQMDALAQSRSKPIYLPLPKDARSAGANAAPRPVPALAEAAQTTAPGTLQVIANAIAPVLDPSATSSGNRPADAPQPGRIAPGGAAEPIAEIKLQLSTGTQPDAEGGRSTDRRAAQAIAPSQLAAQGQAAEPIVLDSAPIPTEAAPTREASSPVPARPQVRPQDLSTLVDRLVEARENARSSNASLSVMHADFGRVSMHFAHDNGNLTVSLANSDPGFFRAVNAAVAPDAGMNNEAQPQADRRGDGAHSGTARTSAGEHGLAGERGSQSRGERHDRGGTSANPSHRETADAQAGERGIFA